MKYSSLTTVLKRAHCCVSMVTSLIFILLAETSVGLRHKGNTLLNFHGNSAYLSNSTCIRVKLYWAVKLSEEV
jgi:hypothetical protein